VRPKSLKLLEENRGTTLRYRHRKQLSDQYSNNSGNNSKNSKWDCIKLKKLHSKGNNYQGEEIANRMRENICKLFI
jgi:hypothetical protein